MPSSKCKDDSRPRTYLKNYPISLDMMLQGLTRHNFPAKFVEKLGMIQGTLENRGDIILVFLATFR